MSPTDLLAGTTRRSAEMHLSPPARDDAIRLLDEPGTHLGWRGDPIKVLETAEKRGETVKTIEVRIFELAERLKAAVC